MTVMLLPTSFSGVGRRVGVTTTVGSATGSASALLSAALAECVWQTISIDSAAAALWFAESAENWDTGLTSRQRDTSPRAKVQIPTQPRGGPWAPSVHPARRARA